MYIEIMNMVTICRRLMYHTLIGNRSESQSVIRQTSRDND